jgi:hypothetical protein
MLSHTPHLSVLQRLHQSVHNQNIPSGALDLLKLSQVVLRFQTEGNAVKTVVSDHKALIPVPLGYMHIPQTLEEAEGAGQRKALGGIVVAADHDHGYARFHQPLQTPLEDYQRFDLGPDMVEDIPGMDNCIGASLNDPIYRLIKSLVDHLFYPVLAVLVHAAVAGETQMRIRQMNYLQRFLPNPETV